jgi:hypothetical protein
MSKLTDLGKRLDNIDNYIRKDVPKDIWILRAIIPEFINDIKTEATEFEEQKMIEILNELIDQYEFRFNKTFENLNESIIIPTLTSKEILFKNQLYNQYKKNKRKFVKDYGADAEKVMVGRAITLAKKMTEKENKQRIKEMIQAALTKGPVEEIDSASFVQNQKPASNISIVDKEKNPEDVIKVDVPLLIRLLEYAREDAKTDMDLHVVAENLIELCKEGRTLNMDDYESIVASDEAKND